MFHLSEIIKSITDQTFEGEDIAFTEASVDSRQIESGWLFAAIPGENTDGHQFIKQAFQKGAFAALIQKDIDSDYPILDLRSRSDHPVILPRPPFCIRVENTVEALQKTAAFHRSQLPGMQVLGITGSVGKSTTKELTSEVLSRHYRTLKNMGNLNNEIGLPLTLLRADASYERAVLEMGFYVPGEIKLLCQIANPSIGIITNVGTVHAERAGSQAVIARGKAELVQALPEDGTAILNYDDPWVRPMAEKTKAHVFYYGMNPEANLWADCVQSFGLDGISFRLHYQGRTISLRIPLIGRHSVNTALRAASAGIAEKLSWDEIIEGLKNGQNNLRMSVIHVSNGAMILDDTYNSSPESAMAVLDLFSELPGYRIAILGDMRELGQYEIKGHQMVGTRTAEVCDELIAVGSKTKILVDSALKSGMPAEKIKWVETVPEAVEIVKSRGISKNEIALVKGSHSLQMEQIVEALEKSHE